MPEQSAEEVSGMTASAAAPVRNPMTLIDSPPSPALDPRSRRRRGSRKPPAASPAIDPEARRSEERRRARIVRTKDGLTYREMTFLRYYLDVTNERTCMNATRSGLAAGIARPPHAAHVEGSKLRKRAAVQAAIRKALAPAELKWQQVLRRLNALSHADIGDVLWWDEKSIHLRPFEDVPEDARRPRGRVTGRAGPALPGGPADPGPRPRSGRRRPALPTPAGRATLQPARDSARRGPGGSGRCPETMLCAAFYEVADPVTSSCRFSFELRGRVS
jgi:hypothetical protein